jgi:site-specific DNA recombinase
MTPTKPPRLRCAVYTRKSTEEGLDQEFNSLDAQREACAAYVASQTGLGWTLLPDIYDDGGISGGTMERPALRRLLADIADRRVDVVVVYKIDRLTRSLVDFCKIVEVFDANAVSFVSVTQQFNTTSSMGRLTLNILLSFAQFEREVTAERIRDKIAASKKKGMWMGGIVPLGYRVEDRKLVIHEPEAATVRLLFERYLELRSVPALVVEARDRGLSTRCLKKRDGTVVTSMPFRRGNLYHLLSNPIYVGKIRHHDKIYDGEHSALLPLATFEAAQRLLADQAPARRQPKNSDQLHLLTGLLFDETGGRMRSVHTNKKGVRYRYYVSKPNEQFDPQDMAAGWRLPAKEVETIVERALDRVLRDRALLSEWLGPTTSPRELTSAFSRADAMIAARQDVDRQQRRERLTGLIARIDIEPGALILAFDRLNVAAVLLGHGISTFSASEGDATSIVKLTYPFTMKRRGIEARMVLTDGTVPAPAADVALIDLVGRAHRYLQLISDGTCKSMTDVATICGTDTSEVSRLLPLAFLAPNITGAILAGTQPVDLTARGLSRIDELPLCWQQQSLLVGV